MGTDLEIFRGGDCKKDYRYVDTCSVCEYKQKWNKHTIL